MIGGAAMAQNCQVPDEVKFIGTTGQPTVRYERMSPGGVQVVAGSGGVAGAAHFQDCTTGYMQGGVQWVEFDFATHLFFGYNNGAPGIGDHLGFIGRGKFLADPNHPLQGRGVIFHKDWGVLGEYFSPPDKYCQSLSVTPMGGVPCPTDGSAPQGGRVFPFALMDGVWYHVSAHIAQSGIAYTITAPDGTYQSYWAEASPSQLPANFQGFSLFTICAGGCDGKDFVAHFGNIRLGWFLP